MAPTSEISVRARPSRAASPPPLRAAGVQEKLIKTKDCSEENAENAGNYNGNTIEDTMAVKKQPTHMNSAVPVEHRDGAQGRHSFCSKRLAVALFAATFLFTIICALVWLEFPLIDYMYTAAGQLDAVLHVAVQQVRSKPVIFSSLLAIPPLTAMIGMGVVAAWRRFAASPRTRGTEKEKSI